MSENTDIEDELPENPPPDESTDKTLADDIKEERSLEGTTKQISKPTLDFAIKEAEKVEEKTLSRIEKLNSRSSTILTYLVGGTGIFTAISVLLSFFNLPGLGGLHISFYQRLIESDYIILGGAFFLTSIAFALLGTSTHRLAGGVEARELEKVCDKEIKSKNKLKKRLLECLIFNIRHNCKTSFRKASLIVASLLSLTFSFTFIGIGMSKAIGRITHVNRFGEPIENGGATLESSSEIYYGLSNPIPTHSLEIIQLLVIYFFTLIVAFSPLAIRWVPETYKSISEDELPRYYHVVTHHEYWPIAFLIFELMVILYLLVISPFIGSIITFNIARVGLPFVDMSSKFLQILFAVILIGGLSACIIYVLHECKHIVQAIIDRPDNE